MACYEGWKHRENFKAYYQTFAQQWEQEQRNKEMQNQMQIMQHIQAGGTMPPGDPFQQRQQQPFGGPAPQYPPPHHLGMPPPNINMMGQQQHFAQQHPVGMMPPQPNMMGHPPMLQGPGGLLGPPGSAPHLQFRQPPAFQPPPLFPQQMQGPTETMQMEATADIGSLANEQ